MLVCVDLKYLERGPQLPLQPISIGLVAEDGAEMYLINEDCLSNVIRHPWASVNVVPTLPIHQDIPGNNAIYEWHREHPEYPHVVSLDTFGQAVYTFLERTGPDLELWTYLGAGAYVVLSQLWGSMSERPAGIPPLDFDLQQVIAMRRKAHIYVPPLPPQPEVANHALWDARWDAAVYDLLFPEIDIKEMVIPPLPIEAAVQLDPSPNGGRS
jgi:hypothetical protein